MEEVKFESRDADARPLASHRVTVSRQWIYTILGKRPTPDDNTWRASKMQGISATCIPMPGLQVVLVVWTS